MKKILVLTSLLALGCVSCNTDDDNQLPPTNNPPMQDSSMPEDATSKMEDMAKEMEDMKKQMQDMAQENRDMRQLNEDMNRMMQDMLLPDMPPDMMMVGQVTQQAFDLLQMEVQSLTAMCVRFRG